MSQGDDVDENVPLQKGAPKRSWRRDLDISRSQVDSLWEEEEQQRDQAAGGCEDPAGVRSPPCADEGGSDSCQIRGADREGRMVARSPVSKMISPRFGDSAAVSLGQRRAYWPAAQVLAGAP